MSHEKTDASNSAAEVTPTVDGNGVLRRDVLRVLAAGAATVGMPGALMASPKGPHMSTDRERGGGRSPSLPAWEHMPAIFAAHGNPMFMDDAVFMKDLHDWALALPRPKAVLMVSAHWEAQPLTIGATRTVPLVYDFYGFPERYYQVQYAAPAAPELAQRVRALLQGAGMKTAEAPSRGLDHGAYVPMICMYPEADVPVLQISLPSMDPQEVFEAGMALAPLRKEGVLIVGAGFLTHNLRSFVPGPNPKTPDWAKDFDAWTESALSRRDFDGLLDYRSRAPGVRMALPSHEHFVPVLLAAGTSANNAETVKYPITGFLYGTFTKRSVQFG